MKELQAAKTQVAQAQKNFVKELKLEISEREQAHAEQIKLIKVPHISLMSILMCQCAHLECMLMSGTL